MDVLVLTQHHPPAMNPPAARWAWLIAGLEARGHTVTLVHPAARFGRPTRGHGLVTRALREAASAASIVISALRCPAPHVVVATAPPPTLLLAGAVVSVIKRRPLVLELRDAWPELAQNWREWNTEGTSTGDERRWVAVTEQVLALTARLMLAIERRAVGVVVTTNAHVKSLERRGVVRVVRVRNTAPTVKPIAPRSDHRELRVLYAGTVGRAQQLSTAVRAVAEASRSIPIQLRIVGSGAHWRMVQRVARDLDAPVEFITRVPAWRLPEHYTWADTVLVILRDWPALDVSVPSKTYEALAFGRHVSASIRGATAKVLTDSGGGDVVTPGDWHALAQLWVWLHQNPARLDHVGRPADWLERNADPEVEASAFDALLREVTRAQGATSGAFLTRWAQDLVLTVSTSMQLLYSEPAHFVLQLARRLHLPVRPPAPNSGPVKALLTWAADRPDLCKDLLEQSGPPWQGVYAELAAQTGVASPEDLTHAPAARAWLLRGDLTRAQECLPARHRLKRRLESERRVWTVGHVLPSGPPVAIRAISPLSVLMVLTNCVPYTRSGYTARSQAILRALLDAGVPVQAVTRLGYPTIIGRPGAPRKTVVDDIVYWRLKTWTLPARAEDRLADQVEALVPIARHVRPTLLHTTTDFTNALTTQALAQRLDVPWVYEMRGQLELSWISARPDHLQEDAAHSERVALWRARETELARRADAVVVLSQVQRADLVERGVPAERITIVPNSVPVGVLRRRPAEPRDTRRRLGLPEAGFWVGSVSALVDYEGFDVLIRAVAQARDAGADIRLALVGDGAARPRLSALVSQLGLGPDVAVLPGRVDPAVALSWHEALDVFAIPRRDTRVCRVVTPLKPMEAMALRRPILASDLPPLREIVADPGSGWVLPAEDVDAWAATLVDIAQRPDELAHRGYQGRVFAADRTWTTAATTLRLLYQQLLGSQR